jgi:hypothetical protein
MDYPSTTSWLPLPNDLSKDKETCNAAICISPFEVCYLTTLSTAKITECRRMNERKAFMD